MIIKNNRYCYLNWGLQWHTKEFRRVRCDAFFFGTHFYLEVSEPAGIVVGPKLMHFQRNGAIITVETFEPPRGKIWCGKTRL